MELFDAQREESEEIKTDYIRQKNIWKLCFCIKNKGAILVMVTLYSCLFLLQLFVNYWIVFYSSEQAVFQFLIFNAFIDLIHSLLQKHFEMTIFSNAVEIILSVSVQIYKKIISDSTMTFDNLLQLEMINLHNGFFAIFDILRCFQYLLLILLFDFFYLKSSLFFLFILTYFVLTSLYASSYLVYFKKEFQIRKKRDESMSKFKYFF